MRKEDKDIAIVSFQKESTTLTLQLKKEKPMEYEFGMLYYQISEMKHGFIPSKVFKTTKAGTKIKFVPMTSENTKTFLSRFEEEVKNFVLNWKINPLPMLFPELEKGGEQ